MTTHVNTPEKAHKLSEIIEYYGVCNRAEGKSPATTGWYSDMLFQFEAYLQTMQYPADLSSLNINAVRGYVLYLKSRPKFQKHPFTPPQPKLLSPFTVQCHVRALKAFSSW